MAAIVTAITSWLCSESGVEIIHDVFAETLSFSAFAIVDGETRFGSYVVGVRCTVRPTDDGQRVSATIGASADHTDGGPTRRSKSSAVSSVSVSEAVRSAWLDIDPNVARFIDIDLLVAAVNAEIEYAVEMNSDVLTHSSDARSDQLTLNA